jgi:DNA-binding transcriptional LysR family regulator
MANMAFGFLSFDALTIGRPGRFVQCMIDIIIMRSVHARSLAGVDLNLLVVLDALLAERHVTRAAARVGLSQSAASHALARLRELLDDQILVRGAQGKLVPTARAEALLPALRRSLDGLADVLRGTPTFEPATAHRSFRIGTGDYPQLVLLPRLVAQLTRDAPGVDLWIVQLPDDPAAALAAGEIDLALVVTGPSWPAGIYQRALFDEHFRCVLRKGHPATKRTLTVARYCELDHLLVAPRGTPGSRVDDVLAALGRTRRVVARVPHFLIAPHVIASSDLCVTIAARLAALYAEPLGLALLPTPFEMGGFTIGMAWHERAHADPGHRWLRDQIYAAR